MPKMGVDPESIKAPKPVPNDWYEVKLVKLSAKFTKGSKPEEGRINYLGSLKIFNARNPEHNDAFVPFNINNGPFQGFGMVDFCHMLGMHLEKDGTFPGGQDAWLFDPNDKENVDKAQYKGPLVGRTGRCQVGTKNYEGNDSNMVVQVTCKVPDCATKYPDIRHRTNLQGKG